MITSGLDHLLNVWDMRTYKQLRSIKMSAGAASLAFSQKNFIAAGLKNQVAVLTDDIIKTLNKVIRIFRELQFGVRTVLGYLNSVYW